MIDLSEISAISKVESHVIIDLSEVFDIESWTSCDHRPFRGFRHRKLDVM